MWMDYFAKKINFEFFALRAYQIAESKNTTIVIDTDTTAVKPISQPIDAFKNDWVKNKGYIYDEVEKVEEIQTYTTEVVCKEINSPLRQMCRLKQEQDGYPITSIYGYTEDLQTIYLHIYCSWTKNNDFDYLFNSLKVRYCKKNIYNPYKFLEVLNA